MLTAETEQGVKNAVELYPRNSSVRVNLRGFRKIAERRGLDSSDPRNKSLFNHCKIT